MSKKNLKMREIIYEYEEEKKWNMSEEEKEFLYQISDNIDTLTNFEKIKYKPKHIDEEILTFQIRKKKLNHRNKK